MTGTEIYKRTASYESDAKSIRLHAPEWKLLLAYDGQRSLAEVAMSVEMAFAEALPLSEKFLGNGWIEEQPITLDQYLKRTGAVSASSVGSAVTPSVVLHEPKPEMAAPAAVLASAVMEETAPAFVRRRSRHLRRLRRSLQLRRRWRRRLRLSRPRRRLRRRFQLHRQFQPRPRRSQLRRRSPHLRRLPRRLR